MGLLIRARHILNDRIILHCLHEHALVGKAIFRSRDLGSQLLHALLDVPDEPVKVMGRSILVKLSAQELDEVASLALIAKGHKAIQGRVEDNEILERESMLRYVAKIYISFF